MKTLFVWTKDFPEAQAAVREHAPDAEIWFTGKGLDNYPRKTGSLWGQDDLLIVEQDIVLTADVIPSMAACPEPWCVYTYDLGVNKFPMKYGLGCTKFSLDLQKQVPFERVLTHTERPCDWCGPHPCPVCPCHGHQDTHIRHELMKDFGVKVSPHVHGHLEHLHVFASETLISDALGRYLWMDRSTGLDQHRVGKCRHCHEPIFHIVIHGGVDFGWVTLDVADCPGGEHYPAPRIFRPDDEIEDWDV